VAFSCSQENAPPPQNPQPFLKKCSKTNPPPCADKPPVPTYAPDPEYPKDAEKAKVEGTVVLEVVVGTDGRAHDIHVVTSVGHGLDEEAVRTLNQWRFKPGKNAGRPAPVQISVQVDFRYSPR
jgi:TonB family protein